MHEHKPGLISTMASINTSKNYDKNVNPKYYEQFLKFKGRARLGRYIAEKLASFLPIDQDQPAKKVLDIATGTGLIAEELHKSGYQVTATDFSINALTYLKEKRPHLNPVQLDMNDQLPFAAESFDGITTVAANRYMTDTKKLLAETLRVLKPGGIFLWPVFEAESMVGLSYLKMLKTFKPEKLKQQALEVGYKDVVILRPGLKEILNIIVRKFLQPEYVPILIVATK